MVGITSLNWRAFILPQQIFGENCLFVYLSIAKDNVSRKIADVISPIIFILFLNIKTYYLQLNKIKENPRLIHFPFNFPKMKRMGNYAVDVFFGTEKLQTIYFNTRLD